MAELMPGEKIQKTVTTSRRYPHYLKYYTLSIIVILLGVFLLMDIVVLFTPDVGIATSISLIVLGAILWAATELKRIADGKYVVTNQRLIAKKGIIRTSIDAISYNLIVNVKVFQSFSEKILGIGNIEISTARGNQELIMIGINKFYNLENIIYKFVESPGRGESRPFRRPTKRPVRRPYRRR